ncbi:MAG: hypothetical protein IKP07_04035 [Bacilli bacterium]|nr:hypothetical protein [Bacilli bacterium]
MVKRKVVEEKKIDKKNEIKIKIWKIVNFVFIVGVTVFFAVYYARESVQNVWLNLDGVPVEIRKELEEVINSVLRMVTIDTFIYVGIYAILQIYYYVLYLFKLKKVLYISMLLQIIIFCTGLVNIDLLPLIFPIISVLIYLRMLKLEEK